MCLDRRLRETKEEELFAEFLSHKNWENVKGKDIELHCTKCNGRCKLSVSESRRNMAVYWAMRPPDSCTEKVQD